MFYQGLLKTLVDLRKIAVYKLQKIACQYDEGVPAQTSASKNVENFIDEESKVKLRKSSTYGPEMVKQIS